LVEHNRESGVVVIGADVTMEGTVVRETRLGGDGAWGRGMHVQISPETGRRSNATVRSCTFEGNLQVGFAVADADASLESSIVRGTQSLPDGTFGDGIAVVFVQQPPTLSVSGSRVEGNARAGLANFGGVARVGTTIFECNAFALDAETYHDGSPSFEDLGGNTCGCSGASEACKSLSSQLEAPDPLVSGPVP